MALAGYSLYPAKNILFMAILAGYSLYPAKSLKTHHPGQDIIFINNMLLQRRSKKPTQIYGKIKVSHVAGTVTATISA